MRNKINTNNNCIDIGKANAAMYERVFANFKVCIKACRYLNDFFDLYNWQIIFLYQQKTLEKPKHLDILFKTNVKVGFLVC